MSELQGTLPVSIRPFDTSDFFRSFFDGAIWGGFGLALLALGAWLISVARSRVNFNPSTRSTLATQPSLALQAQATRASQATQNTLENAQLNSNPSNPTDV
jgi:hypothetical protein